LAQHTDNTPGSSDRSDHTPATPPHASTPPVTTTSANTQQLGNVGQDSTQQAGTDAPNQQHRDGNEQHSPASYPIVLPPAVDTTIDPLSYMIAMCPVDMTSSRKEMETIWQKRHNVYNNKDDPSYAQVTQTIQHLMSQFDSQSTPTVSHNLESRSYKCPPTLPPHQELAMGHINADVDIWTPNLVLPRVDLANDRKEWNKFNRATNHFLMQILQLLEHYPHCGTAHDVYHSIAGYS